MCSCFPLNSFCKSYSQSQVTHSQHLYAAYLYCINSMCGIIAYKGSLGLELITEGLKRLEYRGYDSWGIAWKRPGIISHIKDVGTVQAIPDHITTTPTLAIGHTRWATHGEVSRHNAHPHLSYDSRVAVVHNGIIENHTELRNRLQEEGIAFSSQTDSEVIANLIAFNWKHDFHFAVQKTLKALQGNYAIVLINAESNHLWFARSGSPLIIGTGKHGVQISSDSLAFHNDTTSITYLGESEFGYIDTRPCVFDIGTDREIEKRHEQFTQQELVSQLGSFDHFMHKEIMEQPNTITHAINQNPATWSKAVEMLRLAFGVFFVGCGTSYHACLEASYVFSQMAKRHINTVLASEFEYSRHFLTPHTVMIALSQSGETADVLDAVRTAKRLHVKVISIVNVTTSTLARLSDVVIPMHAGPEQSVLSTKSFTAQLSIILALAGEIANKPITKKLQCFHTENAKWLPQWEKHVQPLVATLQDAESCYLIGRGTGYPLALEGALKLKEGCYIHAEGFAAGELKHGTLALIEPKTVVIALVSPENRSHMLSTIAEVKARGATVAAIDAIPDEMYDIHITIPNCGITDPLHLIIPLQLTAYYLAVSRNINPDRPRNLAKSVTVR